MNCTVTLTADDGVEHSVEVTASSVYEAAVRGLRALKLSDWSREETYDASNLKIAAKTPIVVHTVNLRKFKAWLAKPAGQPSRCCYAISSKGTDGAMKIRCSMRLRACFIPARSCALLPNADFAFGVKLPNRHPKSSSPE